MAKKNKFGNSDQFILQSLLESDGEESHKKTIILIIITAIIILSGVVIFHFINNVEINWEIRLPWQSEDDDPIFTIKKEAGTISGKKKEETEELVVPSFAISKGANNGQAAGCNIITTNLAHDSKGYTFDIEITPLTTIKFEINKIILDGYPFDVDFKLDDFNNKYKGQVRIKQTDLDKRNMIGFKKMTIYYTTIDVYQKSVKFNNYSPAIVNNITYDNDIKGLIEIYNVSTNYLAYYKTEEDKDNTYLYFYFNNSDKKYTKEIIVKKLLINGEIFKIDDFQANIYYKSRDIFYLTIPKRKIREVENFTVSFLITTVNEDEYYNSVVYQTKDYTKEI